MAGVARLITITAIVAIRSSFFIDFIIWVRLSLPRFTR
jgi:hypothetical protein